MREEHDVRTHERNCGEIFLAFFINFPLPTSLPLSLTLFCLVAILLTIYLMVVYCHYTRALFTVPFLCLVSSSSSKILREEGGREQKRPTWKRVLFGES